MKKKELDRSIIIYDKYQMECNHCERPCQLNIHGRYKGWCCRSCGKNRGRAHGPECTVPPTLYKPIEKQHGINCNNNLIK